MYFLLLVVYFFLKQYKVRIEGPGIDVIKFKVPKISGLGSL